MMRAATVAAALWAGAAAADPPQARAAAEASGRTFRDWRLDCGGAGCAIRADLRGGDGGRVLTLEAAGGDGGGRLRLSTPLPLHLTDGVTLALGEAPLRAIPWRTCSAAQGWCDAVAPLEPDLMAALRRERAVEVVLTLVDGVRVRLPVSLLGFTAAWAALDGARGQPGLTRRP